MTFSDPSAWQGVLAFGGNDIFVVNLPPFGCFPAMLTLFQSPTASYDGYGCLKDINKISASHNQILGEKMIALRTKYPTANLYYGDIHGVYTDILKNPTAYSMAFYTLHYTISYQRHVANIIQIHNIVLWESQYFIEYSLIFSTFSLNLGIPGNIPWSTVSPT